MTGRMRLCALVFCALAALVPVAAPAASGDAAPATSPPNRTISDFEQMPPEVQVLLNALVGALRGENRIDSFGPVIFEYPALENLRALEPFTYEGLGVTSFQLTHVGIDAAEESKTLVGVIRWFDDNNARAAATTFGITYRSIGSNLFVKEVRVERMSPNHPRLALFVVPKSRVESAMTDASQSFVSLLLLASENAMSPDGAATGFNDYLLFAFCLDRLGRGDRIDLLLALPTAIEQSDAAEQVPAVRPEFQKLIDYTGYQVAVMEMAFDPAQAEPVRLEVYYTPAGQHPTLEPAPHLVNTYSLTD